MDGPSPVPAPQLGPAYVREAQDDSGTYHQAHDPVTLGVAFVFRQLLKTSSAFTDR